MILSVTLFPLLISIAAARRQVVGAVGHLLCYGKPASGLEVHLMEHEWPAYDVLFPPDTLLAKTVTDEEGFFAVNGTHDAYSPIEPFVDVNHTCNSAKEIKTVHVDIPRKYIQFGDEPEKPFYRFSVELSTAKEKDADV